MIKKLLPIFVLALLTGCASHFPDPGPRLGGATKEYAVPPKELFAKAKQAIAPLPIDSESKGTIVTDWQEFPGDWHVARRWQERTRYRVSITPDFEDPTGRSRLEVTEETQQRATEGQQWKSSTDIPRPKRAAELLQKIDQQIVVK